MAPNSPVQDLALRLLDMKDVAEKEGRRVDMVKSLLTHRDVNADEVAHQFPEYFPRDPFAEALDEEGEFDIDKVDDSQIAWGTPRTEDEDEALSRWISEQEAMSFTADELATEWH